LPSIASRIGQGEGGFQMIVTRRSGVTIALSLTLMTATVLCVVSGSAGAASAGQVGPAAVPSAHFAETSGLSTLDFAGYPWTVKSSTSPTGPGPNIFDAAGPFVDPSGALHLQIVKTTAGWESSEVILNPTLGYGTYRWTVEGPLSTLDPNVVLSLFTYDDSDTSPSNREMDFEASRSLTPGTRRMHSSWCSPTGSRATSNGLPSRARPPPPLP
jgi:hypothetical protein